MEQQQQQLEKLKQLFGKIRFNGRDRKESKHFYMQEIIEANEVVDLIGVLSDIKLEKESIGLHTMYQLMLNVRRKIAIIEEKQKQEQE